MHNLLLRVWFTVLGRFGRDEGGQSTVEYALVIIAAAAIASLVLVWAQRTHGISRLFDAIIGKVLPH